jgi:hypothetical protein
MNMLIVDALDFDKLAVHETGWGSRVAWLLYDRFDQHVRA